ncbi:FAD-linked oxidase C-terminal domain-containing protein [Spongiactinospora sp. TRM90649]|uniref:FAD-binding oxidoreductase n=1 Tax=Spongiactinospora sp. TRM90649 TaxID=3031114 RepID=UPI0023F940CE|nr:FAD-linked oxidase C-terminal domain-containing protein [Spongiactinospora sp. TRM90649]MDF5752307.1 FAD-linked oxidase C-terminal domain-containing protein [Spongiactinospora sp. TRM90649]
MSSSTIDLLVKALPHGRVITDPDVMDSYARDRTFLDPGAPLGVVLAAGRDDVVETMRWATEHRVPVVPRGAGTGLAGGATATEGSVVLSLARMAEIRELSPADEIAVVEPGVITADLDAAAREHGLMYAPDPSSYEISTIGGNLATNAGGLRCVKYGVTRDSALGLEVVLADGRILNTGRRTVKGVTGYDLTGLFVGSEGTLGVITAATVRLRRAPLTAPATIAAEFGSLRDAASAVSAIIAAGCQPSLLELLDRATLKAIDDWRNIGLEPSVAAMLIAQSDAADGADAARRMHDLCVEHGASFVAVSDSPAETEGLIGIRRMAYPAKERLGSCLVEDVCVPRSALPDMMTAIEAASARHDVLICTVAHAGDGNLHPVFVFDHGVPEPPKQVWDAADEVFRAALDLGGTLTGEHGVGLLKRRWLELESGPLTRDLQAGIKGVFDPLGILNPGKAI